MASSVVFLFLRVKKEVDEVIGMKQDISYDDLGQLVYLSQVHILKLGKNRNLITHPFIHSLTLKLPRTVSFLYKEWLHH